MVFGVGQFNYVSHIWLGQTLVAIATKICDFQHKIGYKSACAEDTSQMLALARGFSGLVEGIHDVITHARFGDDCLTGSWVVWGSKFSISH